MDTSRTIATIATAAPVAPVATVATVAPAARAARAARAAPAWPSSALRRQAPGPRHVAARRRVFHLEHGGAELGEKLAGRGPGRHAWQLYDDDAVEQRPDDMTRIYGFTKNSGTMCNY